MGDFFAPDEPKIDPAVLNRQEEERKRVEAEKAQAERERRAEQTAQNRQETLKRKRQIGARSLFETSTRSGLGGPVV